MTATKKQARFIEDLAARVGQDTAKQTWAEITGAPIDPLRLTPSGAIDRSAAYYLDRSQASAVIDALLEL